MKHQVYYHTSGQTFSCRRFAAQLRRLTPSGRPVLILCIGSDRSTGDSLGPLIGYKLKETPLRAMSVLGTLSCPVHAVNLEDTLEKISLRKDRPFIIAVEASRGHPEHVGCITLSNSSLQPGLGLGKSLPAVGHISITGIVGALGSEGMAQLQNVRLSLVMELADCIPSGLLEAYSAPAPSTGAKFYRPQSLRKWWPHTPAPKFPAERPAVHK